MRFVSGPPLHLSCHVFPTQSGAQVAHIIEVNLSTAKMQSLSKSADWPLQISEALQYVVVEFQATAMSFNSYKLQKYYLTRHFIFI